MTRSFKIQSERANVTWTAEAVATCKKRVVAEITELKQALTEREVVGQLVQKIAALEADDTPDTMLYRYMLILGALVQHERSGGLSRAQTKSLAEVGKAILQAMRIDPERSRLALLHADLYRALSLINRRRGDHWVSTWQHLLSSEFGRADLHPDTATEKLGNGLRALRFGYTKLAESAFHDALKASDITEAQKWRCQLSLAKTLRLAHRFADFHQLVESIKNAPDIPGDIGQELAWEELACASMQAGSPAGLIQAISRKGQHREAAYVIETFFWSAACQAQQWIERVPKMRAVQRKLDYHESAVFGFFLDSAKLLEECMEEKRFRLRRVERLGEMLCDSSRLMTIDRELLFWGAACRWLHRARLRKFAMFAWGRYREISFVLTNGVSEDGLCLLSDLENRTWLDVDEAAPDPVSPAA